YDEGLDGLNALSILHDRPLRLYFENREFFDGKATNAEEPLFHYLLAIAIAFAGPTVLALRLTSAIIGTATVGVFYAMVRTIWGRNLALLSALLLAVCRWHVHFSRTSFRTILVPLFACLFFWLWWNGVERRSKIYLILSGIALGLGFYTYFAFQLILPAWLCYIAMRWLVERDHRGNLRQAFIFTVAAALITVAPLIGYFATHHDVATGRVGALSIFAKDFDSALRTLGHNLWVNIHHFWWRGDHVAKHNVPHMAVFDPLTAAVFLVGLISTIFGVRRDLRNLLVLLWAVWISCASVFSEGAPNLLRTLGMVPAVVLILGNGYVLLFRAAERVSRRVAIGALVAMLSWFVANETYRYFTVWRADPAVRREFNYSYRQLAQAILSLDKDTDVYLPGDYYSHCSVRYLLYERKNVRPMVIPDSFLATKDARHDRALFYSHMTFLGNTWMGDLLPKVFPEGETIWHSTDGFFAAYQIAAGDLLTPDRAPKFPGNTHILLSR
ncbi:glycosyltransferase family 39 protein, partial [Candidatus Sumerlaeota bacterium]|nr:glycosyltransferase family 39 protein [Candidatus Sumerlaeota bacterium]